MSVTFIPADQQFIVSSDPEWSINGWGMDTCQVLWRGPRTKSDAFLDSQIKFSPLEGYPRVWLDNTEKRNITPNFPGVLNSYIGFRSGTIPRQKRVNGTSAQQITKSAPAVTGDLDGQTITGEFQYLASRTTWTWFETANPPNNPRYNSVDGGVNPLLRLTQFTFPPVPGPDGDLVPVPLADAIAVFNKLTPVVLLVDYEREELIPNAFWACRSVIEWRLQ